MRTVIPIAERLERYLSGSRPHHALILAGPHTPAKEAIVRQFAGKLLTRHSPKHLAAGIADRVNRDIHPDVLWIKEEGEDTIKIDRIREVCHQMEIAPLEAEAKICVLEECHRMGTGAANAFLKTLEEPLPNRYFWLMTSQIGSLLPTMLSRCLVFLFPPDSDGAEVVVSPHWGQFERAWADGRFESFADSFEEKHQAIAFVKTLQYALRNTVLASVPETGASADPFINGLSTVDAIRRFDGVVKLESQLRSNANFSLLLESSLTQLWHGRL